MPDDEKQFRADGTISVRFGASDAGAGDGGRKRRLRGINEVTFIPDQYVEHNGSKFVVFVPWDGGTAKADQRLPASEAKPAYIIAAKGVTFDGNFANKQQALLQAAVNRIKVTVLVSCKRKSCGAEGELTLDEIFIPAIPT